MKKKELMKRTIYFRDETELCLEANKSDLWTKEKLIKILSFFAVFYRCEN